MKDYKEMNLYDKASIIRDMLDDDNFLLSIEINDEETFCISDIELFDDQIVFKSNNSYAEIIRFSQKCEEQDEKNMLAIKRFIASATTDQIATMLTEINTVHDNLMCFNLEHKQLDKIESVSVNGDSIQLNLE